MILAVDVSYRDTGAVAAGMLFGDWEDAEPLEELTVRIPAVAEYEPGQFYRRELPCVLALLEKLEQLPEYIVVDAHVYLDARQRPGLGKHLYDALGGKCAIIGVAKSRHRDTPPDAAVFRGGSRRPLYVTAAGIDQSAAKEFVRLMYGEHRLPEILKRADQLSKL